MPGNLGPNIILSSENWADWYLERKKSTMLEYFLIPNISMEQWADGNLSIWIFENFERENIKSESKYQAEQWAVSRWKFEYLNIWKFGEKKH